MKVIIMMYVIFCQRKSLLVKKNYLFMQIDVFSKDLFLFKRYMLYQICFLPEFFLHLISINHLATTTNAQIIAHNNFVEKHFSLGFILWFMFYPKAFTEKLSIYLIKATFLQAKFFNPTIFSWSKTYSGLKCFLP